MQEDQTIRYIQRVAAIILKKMDHLELKIDRVELYVTRQRTFFGTSTKEWERDVDENLASEEQLRRRLEKLRAEFDALLRRQR